MNETIFVIGGCRSGKSSHALRLAEEISAKNRVFIATCVPQDEEMRERVSNHQEERGAEWKTVEEPIFLPEAILENSQQAGVVLADCLTLWISNLLMEDEDFGKIAESVRQLTQVIAEAKCPVILVSNEVGAGIVPENKLARLFRDAVGFANQRIAASVHRVIWMVAGIPVPIKRGEK